MNRNPPLLAAAGGLAAAAAMSMLVGPAPEPRFYRESKPRPKSTHKRKFKGSKAAKKASRRKA